ncbi:spondin domain-containing protein [Paraglaciecola aquimarina]|uniref:Spondin domain-containing protein n=1 Tax=Paraglaciecola aquimarina TaxID=1235557 RepID=A0ABU3SUJ4_9ALTE|nr:spondin domain-containing protein [Paraglaciecola aquimarina]MDU0353666.1 spondin domain-containing protein [Paraglaciecola aquimarina]
MKQLSKIFAASALAFGTSQTMAADITVEIQNLTQGLYFTPIATVAHTADTSLFEVGEMASAEIQEMAEGGSLAGLTTVATSINADMLAETAAGPLAPTAKVSGSFMTADTNTTLSIVAMILPSNDGFIGLDNWTIPTEAGTYTVYLNAYDAGTEANDELVGGGAPGVPGMPAPPFLTLGTGGSGVTSTESNSMIHIHPGNIGDDSLTDGKSDVTNTVHRWLNPVAKVTVTVN